MKLSVVIPVHDGGENLRRCLEALAISTRPPDELIVVDDASTDGSGELAQRFGARVVRLAGSPHGPAATRNRGAEAAQGDVLVFFDADVAVHPDTLARIEQYLSDRPGVAALFGSYDADPPARGLVTRYKNLLHHYVHQHGRREAVTFWTGCGAIRRGVFLALGGFDERCITMEDVELGARLRRAGHRVWLCPDVQVAHLKRWTFVGLLRSDIRDRAIPWTRLILREGRLPADLNLNAGGQVSALAAWMTLVCLALGFWWHWAWAGTLLSMGLLAALNADLYRSFARWEGVRFALGAAVLHALYLLYSSAVFGTMWAWHALAKHKLLALLLLATFLKGWVWSVVVPLWQACDEYSHFGYVQEVTRQCAWPIWPPKQIPTERVLSWDLMRPFDLSGQREPLDLSLAGLAQIDGLKQRLDTPSAHTDLLPNNWLLFFERQHPPLYGTLLAPVHHLWTGDNILVRVAWMRLATVLMAVCTVGCAYGLVRTLWPSRPWLPIAVATLVSFHPLFTFYTSIVNNLALECLCFAALVWLLVIVARHGMNWRRGLALAGALSGGLLTRSSFLAALPLVMIIWGWEVLRKKARCHWGGWLIGMCVPWILSGWWYANFLITGGEAFVRVYKQSTQTATLPVLPYLLHYPWLTRYRPLLREWWGVFGSRDTLYPMPVYQGLEILVGLAFLGWIFFVVNNLIKRVRRQEMDMGGMFVLAMSAIVTLSLIAFYTALDYRMARSGSWFKIQGRYFLAPVAAQIMALTVGWAQLSRRWVLPALCVGMIGLNAYTTWGVLMPRYYGAQMAVRHVPAPGTVEPLTPGMVEERSFTTGEEGLSRIDVWLSPGDSQATAEANVTLYRDGQILKQVPIGCPQMISPYPTMLHFDLPGGPHSYTLELRGSGISVSLAEDGQLALKTFYRVPVTQILWRMSVVQPDFYSSSVILALGGVYLLTLGLFAWVCLSGAREEIV